MTLIFDQLQDCIPEILFAPKDDAKISVLCRRPDAGQRIFDAALKRDPERGVIGDRWFEQAWIRLRDGDPDTRIQAPFFASRASRNVFPVL